jgi:hypothetical protein
LSLVITRKCQYGGKTLLVEKKCSGPKSSNCSISEFDRLPTDKVARYKNRPDLQWLVVLHVSYLMNPD